MSGCGNDFCTKAACENLRSDILRLQRKINDLERNLVGKQGPPGKDGKPGKNGKDGKNGAQGKPGKNGKDGKNGAQGKPGNNGKDGKDGAQGKPGNNGKDGAIGPMGPMGPRGPAGQPGRSGVGGGGGGGIAQPGPMGPPGPRGPAGPPGQSAPTQPTIIVQQPQQPQKIACGLILTWDANACRLTARLTVGTCTTTAQITMDCKKLEDLLKDIQQKVTITPSIKSGSCGNPLEEGDWMQYTPNLPQIATGMSQAFDLISQQIEAVHKDTCKSVIPKTKVHDLPKVSKCSENPETQQKEVQTLSLAEMQTELGFVPPWAIETAKDVIIPWAIDRGLEWLQKYLEEQSKKTLEATCQLENESPYVLIPDPSTTWNTEGKYIFFYWKIDGENLTDKQKQWRQTTQLVSPIDELINPSDPSKVWEKYFADIYQILGNQWGQVRSKDRAKRYPLYQGWFKDKAEARRFFDSIKKLTSIEYDDKNNPSFPQNDNPSTFVVNTDKKIVLRKVCIGNKIKDKDQVDVLIGYAPKKV